MDHKSVPELFVTMQLRDLPARNPAPLGRVPRIAAQGVVVLHVDFEMRRAFFVPNKSSPPSHSRRAVLR